MLVGVTVDVGSTVSVGVSVFVGVTVDIGVGVLVGATVGVDVVIVTVMSSVEDSSVLLLRLFLVLLMLVVSSAELIGIVKRLPKNIIVTIMPQSPFLGLNLFLILSQIGGHTNKEHNKNSRLFPRRYYREFKNNSFNSIGA